MASTDLDTQLSAAVLVGGLVVAEWYYSASLPYIWTVLALSGVCAPLAVGFCLTEFFDVWGAFTVVIIVSALLLLMLVGIVGIPASIGIDISVVWSRSVVSGVCACRGVVLTT